MKKQKKPWIRTCLIASAALFLLAGLFYAYHYRSLAHEFSDYADFLGEHYNEIFNFPSGDEPTEFLERVDAAFNFVGRRQDALSAFDFSWLVNYTCTQGVRQDFDYECITYSMEGDTGYVWIAYWIRCYDADGNLVMGKGSEQQRLLTRWTLENGKITECLEHP